MPYLTYDEYNELGFKTIEFNEFERLLKHASGVLDSATRYFYKHNDLETDIPFRKEQFKKALAAQIEYFHDKGVTSTHGMSEPATVTIGRTTVSKVNRNTSQDEKKENIVSDDVYLHLGGTGLLYSGIGVRS